MTPRPPMPSAQSAAACPSAVHRLVPFVYVTDVEASLAFYALLGLECREIMRDADGRANWAWTQTSRAARNALACGTAQLMLSRTWRTVRPEGQDIMLYLYALDIHALRTHLLAAGVQDGGRFTERDKPHLERRALFDITHPFYMPQGELRIHDPDGYCLLVGQLDQPVLPD